MEMLPSLLAVLATQAPLYIVWLVAIIVAIVRWKRHPRVSLIAIIAIVGLWTTATIVTAIHLWLPFSLHARGFTISEIGRVTALVSITSALVDAAFWAALIFAIFGWRSSR